MEEANYVLPTIALSENESANDAWKKCTTEMVNIICSGRRSAVNKDYSNLLLENRDLKKQYKMAIAALDSIISEKDGEDCSINLKKKDGNVEEKNVAVEGMKDKKNSQAVGLSVPDKHLQWGKDPKSTSKDKHKEEEFLFLKSKSIDIQNCRRNQNFKILQKKFNEPNSTELQEESPSSKKDELRKKHKKSSTTLKIDTQKVEEFICSRCLQEQSDDVNPVSVKNEASDVQILMQDCYKLKRELELARKNNNILKKELINKIDENEQLRDQVQSLELSWKTLTEAINLQDEQLSEYGSVVTTLKNSRSQILEKMKDANARNAHNILIMENIEKHVAQLRSQLDAYSELLSNQSAELIDKASSTEQTFVDQNSFDELIKKKEYYITLLQDRLCEAIVDLKNKDSEIKNHTTSVKSLIQNYEGEKKCLEERLTFANLSMQKLEEHKIKQQETMKQLMKLIEFLQDKLEVKK